MNSPEQTTAAAKTRSRPNKGRRLRRRLPLVGALALLALIVFGLWPKPVQVEATQVIRGPLRVTVNEEGKTRIRNRYLVSAPVTGQLRRIPFKAGAEVVKAETVIATIDPAPPMPLDARMRSLTEARKEAAVATLEKARVATQFADSELRRIDRLFAEGTLSVQDRENAQLRALAAAKDVAAAESAVRQVEAELAEFEAGSGNLPPRPPVEVRAPASGRVLRIFEENARVVTVGTALLEIGDPADLEVIVEVLSRDGAAIERGAPVLLEHWGGPKPLLAKVRLIEPAGFTKISALGVEEQRVNVVADLVTPLEERTGLGDNFRVEARIVLWESDSVMKVPVGALFRQENDWAVFVVEGGRAKMLRVQVGHSNGMETEILAGLNEGDQLILYPGSRVKNGQRIKIISV